MKRTLVLLPLVLSRIACLTPVQAGNSCTPTPGTVCSHDGAQGCSCALGQMCPMPVHGHDTFCCATPGTACAADKDCCSGSCAASVCAKGSALTSCRTDSDCAAGSCGAGGYVGECTPVSIGGVCTASNECASNLQCTNGACACLPAGINAPSEQSSLCCGGWTYASGCVCSSSSDLCMTNSDCCAPGAGPCVNHRCL